MYKKIFIAIVFALLVLGNTTPVSACDSTDNSLPNNGCQTGFYCLPSADPKQGNCRKLEGQDGECFPKIGVRNDGCQTGFYCLPSADPKQGNCKKSTVQSIFGKVEPPPLLAEFLKNDPTGASGISQFLSNFIKLLFSIAAIALIFMIIWGAFDWTTSGGDKEKLASAQKRIINAIIGILLFAVAFAIITILGRFTGFTMFRGQNYLEAEWNSSGIIWRVKCKDGKFHFPKSAADTDPDEICRNL